MSIFVYKSLTSLFSPNVQLLDAIGNVVVVDSLQHIGKFFERGGVKHRDERRGMSPNLHSPATELDDKLDFGFLGLLLGICSRKTKRLIDELFLHRVQVMQNFHLFNSRNV